MTRETEKIMYTLQDFILYHIKIYMSFTDGQMIIIEHQTTRYPMQG
jgi:hypothetical protein